MTTSKALLVGCLALATFVTSLASAQEDATAQARALFNAGAQAYESGKYPAAIQAFEEAYRLSPREGLLFSLAQAHRRQYFVARDPADLRAAVEHYQKYLVVATEAKRRGEAADALAQLEPILARLAPLETAEGGEGASGEAATAARSSAAQLMITSPTPGARLSIDGKDAGALPYIAEVEPGKRRIVVTAPGYAPYEREVNAAKGSIVPLDAELVGEPALLTVRAKKRAKIIVNGRLMDRTPMAQPIALEPGRYSVSVAKNGHRIVTHDVSIGRGESRTLDTALRTSTQRRAAVVMIIAGGVAVVLGGVSGLGALDAQEQAKALTEEQATKNLTDADVDDYYTLRKERDSQRIWAAALGGGGLSLSALGAALYLLDRPRLEESGPRPELTPAAPRPGPTEVDLAVVADDHGAYAAVRGRF